MPTSEISRSDLVRTMVEVGNLVTGPKPFQERMDGLCSAAAYALQADLLAIMKLDGDAYCGRFQSGLDSRLAARFDEYRVDRDRDLIKEIEACDTYLLLNKDATSERMHWVTGATGIASVILVPFTHPDGDPLGYVIAGYQQTKPEVTESEGELALGMARIAQTTILRYIEWERRREVSQAMLQVADSERRRLSRDIHDDPLQLILALRIGLEGFGERLENDRLRDEVAQFVEQCRGASSSLREVMLRTHSGTSELADLHSVLEGLVSHHDPRNALELNFEDNRSAGSPSYLVPALNRIAEQAARNAVRHAAASRLDVTLRDHDGGTLLTITDDGCGFDPSAVSPTRLGLVSMRERTELLGGDFGLTSKLGAGTTVCAWFPHTEVSDEAD